MHPNLTRGSLVWMTSRKTMFLQLNQEIFCVILKLFVKFSYSRSFTLSRCKMSQIKCATCRDWTGLANPP